MKYFLHDSNAFQDEKITELYMKFGYEGVGLFYTILEKLAAQEKPVKTSVLKQQLFVGKKLEKCWQFIESIGLVSSNNGETFNENLLKFSKKYQIKKEQTRERVAKFRENQALTENVTQDVTRYNRVSNARKVNKSKVKVNNNNSVVGSSEPTLFKSLVSYWIDVVHPDFDFNGVSGKSLKSIITKITKRLEKAGKEITDEVIFESFKAICENLPEWFQDKDLSIIDSKFNDLIAQIKTAKNGTVSKSSKQTAYDSAAAFRS
jgi:hypothetical protein